MLFIFVSDFVGAVKGMGFPTGGSANRSGRWE